MIVRAAWTSAEDDVLRAHYVGAGARVCAERLRGRSLLAICKRAGILGLRRLRPETCQRRRWCVREDIDQALRAAHAKPPTAGELRALADRFGYPLWWVSKRARQLGLRVPRFYEPAWSAREIALLRETEDLSAVSARRRLADEGFSRTESAIETKRKRMGLTATAEGYSACEAARLLGVENSTVLRWIKRGWLVARPSRDATWSITDAQLRAFFVAHPMRLDLRRMPSGHAPWLVEMLTGRPCV